MKNKHVKSRDEWMRTDADQPSLHTANISAEYGWANAAYAAVKLTANFYFAGFTPHLKFKAQHQVLKYLFRWASAQLFILTLEWHS